MKYYIIAGEASGDLHGSNLIKEIAKQDKDAQFRYFGGDLMAAAGGQLVKHYSEMAFMGFWEVLTNIDTILANLKFCKKDILDYQPNAVILIDFPGFNMRIARFAKLMKIKVLYYISPQVWAWNKSRIKKIKRFVDKMFVILPFEKEFYKQWDYEVNFVGHPLLDAIAQRKKNENFLNQHNLTDKPIIAILPGSRKQEIAKMLPVMLSVIPYFPNYQFVVACMESVGAEFYEKYHFQNVSFVYNQTYDLLEHATAALVTSGTATLETALFEVPEVVCYKGNPLSMMLGKWLIKVSFISLVNLISEKELVKELVQENLTTENLRVQLNKILMDKNHRENLIAEYKILKQKLGSAGASEKTAKLLITFLRNQKNTVPNF